jgi:hypothetical protein
MAANGTASGAAAELDDDFCTGGGARNRTSRVLKHGGSTAHPVSIAVYAPGKKKKPLRLSPEGLECSE